MCSLRIPFLFLREILTSIVKFTKLKINLCNILLCTLHKVPEFTGIKFNLFLTRENNKVIQAKLITSKLCRVILQGGSKNEVLARKQGSPHFVRFEKKLVFFSNWSILTHALGSLKLTYKILNGKAQLKQNGNNNLLSTFYKLKFGHVSRNAQQIISTT